jgi:hypothetical protein
VKFHDSSTFFGIVVALGQSITLNKGREEYVSKLSSHDTGVRLKAFKKYQNLRLSFSIINLKKEAFLFIHLSKKIKGN